MSDKISLTAELRTDVGKGASRRLRRDGKKVPAIIYGTQMDPQNLTLSANELRKVMQHETFYSQIMDVVVEDKAQQAVVRDLQRSPASGRVMHIDFLRVSLDKELHVNVPLHFTNEDNCVGVKISGGSIAHNLNEVEISALPANLPQFIEVDMTDIDLGSSVHLSDLILPEGVTILALTHGEDRDIQVVSVTAKRGGEEELDDEVLSDEEGETGETPADEAEGEGDAG